MKSPRELISIASSVKFSNSVHQFVRPEININCARVKHSCYCVKDRDIPAEIPDDEAHVRYTIMGQSHEIKMDENIVLMGRCQDE